MTKMRLKLFIFLLFLSTFFLGCSEYQTTGIVQSGSKLELFSNEALIITNADSSSVITYIHLEDGSIYIDCSGGCGDIFIGTEIIQ